ncbi:hypothetical protein DFH09DRAFT_1272296 [Mycena vulgaris]|nr:hypothetical protein DFH09DRAFT_1272296 [Mycena vulgaris]
MSFDSSSIDFSAASDIWLSAALSDPHVYNFPSPSPVPAPTSPPAAAISFPSTSSMAAVSNPHVYNFPSLFPAPAPTSPPAAAISFPSTSSVASGSPEERQQHYFHRFREARFRKHSPQWVNGDWLPQYRYSSAGTIWDYWVEWSEGVDGHIPVRDLNTTWGSKWRRGVNTLRNENTRRMKVIDLILLLSSKPRWDVNLVRRFITETYPHYRARAFSDYLKKSGATVIAAAANYP